MLALATITWGAAWAQAPRMRTRDLTRLTNIEIQAFLKHSDVIFVPVGDIEANGSIPSDTDYTTVLGYAMKMAEHGDGLFLPYLAYFYPGSTAAGEATVFVTPTEGSAYLKAIARSLLRQGFRRQVYVTAGHGPAAVTLGPLIREFFDETKCPIMYIDMREPLRNLKGDFSKVIYGAYSLVGRLEDLPLAPPGSTSAPRGGGQASQAQANNSSALPKLERLGPRGAVVGFYVADPNGHGGLTRATSAQQRADWAKEGEAQLDAAVKGIDIKGVVDALKEHDTFIKELVLPKYKGKLP